MSFSIRLIATALAASTIALFASAAAPAAGSPQQAEIAALAGTFSCVTHTDDGKTYHSTDSNEMWGPWLKSSTTYPAQNGFPSATGMSFAGYDGTRKRWYYTSIDTTGEYGSSYSTSKTYAGSKWVNGYPTMGFTVAISTSKNGYAVDVKGLSEGKMTAAHEVCTRS